MQDGYTIMVGNHLDHCLTPVRLAIAAHRLRPRCVNHLAGLPTRVVLHGDYQPTPAQDPSASSSTRQGESRRRTLASPATALINTSTPIFSGATRLRPHAVAHPFKDAVPGILKDIAERDDHVPGSRQHTRSELIKAAGSRPLAVRGGRALAPGRLPTLTELGFHRLPPSNGQRRSRLRVPANHTAAHSLPKRRRTPSFSDLEVRHDLPGLTTLVDDARHGFGRK